ncbi:hypothetical protein [Nocardioides sp. MH1]|uniref:hypothetical protein n=1 Tax=Nocardioides sp. MH1 TaxID=3242490 RepID=UPI0035216A14
MSDPIEKLTRLGDALEGAPMPLPASEIRARGDRIRRRRQTLVAGVSAAVVAAVAVPTVVLTVGGDDRSDAPVAPQPSISDSVPAAPLSAENLLTSGDAGKVYGSDSTWVDYSTYRGDGQGSYHPCATASFASLGAKPLYKREFNAVPSDTVTGWMTAIAGEFATADDAKAAYDQLSDELAACTANSDTVGKNYQLLAEEDVAVGIGDEAHRILASFVPYGTRGFNEELETGLVLAGNRLEVVVSGVGAQDYVEQMSAILPAAAQRLVLGGGGDLSTETPATWPTTIRADFPLTSGWPTDDGSSEYRLDPPNADNESMVVAALQACGNKVPPPGVIDRLTSSLSYGSASYRRELELFPTDQEAITFLAHVRAVYDGCRTEGSAPTITTTLGEGGIGDESIDVRRASDGVGRTAITAVRVGNGVVLDLVSDEGNGSDTDALATQAHENLADVVAALADLEGTSGSTDPSTPGPDDPARTSTVPSDFPLDLALGAPPADDGETSVSGPGPDIAGAEQETACGTVLTFPSSGTPDPAHELGYAVSGIEGYDGRTIHAYANAQDALDHMAQLRDQLQGCATDSAGDGLSDRIWRSFNSDTGYDSVTFGWYYEATANQGATAGNLFTVERVGNAIVTIQWGGEYSADTQAANAPDQVELAQRIGDQMDCDFSADGC